MSNMQQRLDELLALSNEELDRMAAEVQGWELIADASCSIFGGPVVDLMWKTAEPKLMPVQKWRPSTDLNQAWDLVKSYDITLERQHTVTWLTMANGKELGIHWGTVSLAKAWAIFGILARELEKEKVDA